MLNQRRSNHHRKESIENANSAQKNHRAEKREFAPSIESTTTIGARHYPKLQQIIRNNTSNGDSYANQRNQ